MTRIGIYGARGRMGDELCQAVRSHPEAQLAFLYEREGHGLLGQIFYELKLESDLSALLEKSDVIIDFTTPLATMALLKANKEHKKPLVIGTTGLDSSQQKEVSQAALDYPVVFSPNYSIGVNVLLEVLAQAGKTLSKTEDYDLEIVERHHRYKKDSPSGTALKLAEVAATASGRDLEKDAVYGRDGILNERQIDEIGIFAVRAGDIIGEHTVIFSTLGETIEFSHKAHSRQTFAKGAVAAAKWLSARRHGLFTMKEVLGL